MLLTPPLLHWDPQCGGCNVNSPLRPPHEESLGPGGGKVKRDVRLTYTTPIYYITPVCTLPPPSFTLGPPRWGFHSAMS